MLYVLYFLNKNDELVNHNVKLLFLFAALYEVHESEDLLFSEISFCEKFCFENDLFQVSSSVPLFVNNNAELAKKQEVVYGICMEQLLFVEFLQIILSVDLIKALNQQQTLCLIQRNISF